MKLTYLECSRLLHMLDDRGPVNPAELSQLAGVPSFIITDFNEYGDFRHTNDDSAIERLLEYLQRERYKYVQEALMKFTNEELLREIKSRLESG